VRVLRALYASLDLAFDPEHETRVRAFLGTVRGYRKNRYAINPEQESLIRERLGGDPDAGRSKAPAAESARQA